MTISVNVRKRKDSEGNNLCVCHNCSESMGTGIVNFHDQKQDLRRAVKRAVRYWGYEKVNIVEFAINRHLFKTITFYVEVD